MADNTRGDGHGASTGKEIVVDVRNDLLAGREPFRKIMAAVDETGVGDTLVLHATFKPLPLLLLLKSKGFQNKTTRLGRGHWRVEFHRVSGPQGDAADVAVRDDEAVSGTDAGRRTDAGHRTEAQAPADEGDIHLDNRGLVPPEPMVRTLAAVHKLKKGQRIIGKFDRTPMFLLPKLDDMGFVYEVTPEEDGRAAVTIQYGD